MTTTPAKAPTKRDAATTTNHGGSATAKGDWGAAIATGIRAVATAKGDGGAATATGEYGAAHATGYGGTATATCLDGIATATGKEGAAIATGENGKAKGATGNALFLIERGARWNIVAVWAGIVGQDGIEPDTFYTLQNGKPVKTHR